MTRPFAAVGIALLLLGLAQPAAAQHAASGFHTGLKLKGAHVYNRSSLDTESREFTEAKQGWSVGLELVSENFGVGLTGFTAGRVSEFSADETVFVALAEVNYYAPIRLLRLAPFVGVHTGLGTFTRSYLSEPSLPTIQDRSLGTLGYQVGARFQPISLGSVEILWRRLSASAAAAQDSRLESSQILLGVTLF